MPSSNDRSASVPSTSHVRPRQTLSAPTPTHTHAHTHRHENSHTYIHTHKGIRIHTHTHTNTQRHEHSHIHTYTHRGLSIAGSRRVGRTYRGHRARRAPGTTPAWGRLPRARAAISSQLWMVHAHGCVCAPTPVCVCVCVCVLRTSGRERWGTPARRHSLRGLTDSRVCRRETNLRLAFHGVRIRPSNKARTLAGAHSPCHRGRGEEREGERGRERRTRTHTHTSKAS
jgi:hypothetical protein